MLSTRRLLLVPARPSCLPWARPREPETQVQWENSLAQTSLSMRQQLQHLFGVSTSLCYSSARALLSGDAPSSFIVDGVIAWLASRDAAAATSRRHFEIMVVPMLNPDGCALGYARSDASGHELGRAWRCPKKDKQPSIYHTKRLLRRLLSQERFAVVEVAAHSHKTRSFFYGVQVQDAVNVQNVPPKPVIILAKRHFASTNAPQGVPPTPRSLGPLPAVVPICKQCDFLLAFMYRAPFMMDHRSCSFEAVNLLCPPMREGNHRATEISPATALSAPALSLRQALHRYDFCPSLVLTYYASFFKGSKGDQRRRHLHPGCVCRKCARRCRDMIEK